jgi:hypothetical protein
MSYIIHTRPKNKQNRANHKTPILLSLKVVRQQYAENEDHFVHEKPPP